MKKIILPIAVLAASGAYVWTQQGRLDAGSELDASLAPAAAAPAQAPTATISSKQSPTLVLPSAGTAAAPANRKLASAPAPTPSPVSAAAPAPIAVAPSSAPVQIAAVEPAPAIPLPRPRPAPPAPTKVELVATAAPAPLPLPSSGLRDGSFTGPAEDAYYGTVQVQAQVQAGQLVKVRILQYPSDRRTSRYINGQALPMLQQEAISAQSARIDFVSGATLSSGAFVKSLAGALRMATS